MEFIDTHSHIYLPEFETDLLQMLERAQAADVTKIVMPAIDSSTHNRMFDLADRYSQCISMIGLHPCSVNQSFENELEEVCTLVKSKRCVAIGEIGLDFYWDRTFTEQQYAAFRRQIELALQHNLPVVIHSRNATDECIEVVKEYPGVSGVFHCFSGDVEQARKIIAAEFFLGIGGVVTFKNSGLDKVIREIGIESVVLETDAPYLAPVPFRGKRNEPSYLKMIAERLAELTGKNLEEVAKITTANAIQLFPSLEK